ncbi:hypothetical protein M885DRAFT_502052 [Pelagophyceae sp. CCMP2097]|nr:hypothetical protein M885DRAFT_502052 [Pelagophyceae sp. CCMP2097]
MDAYALKRLKQEITAEVRRDFGSAREFGSAKRKRDGGGAGGGSLQRDGGGAGDGFLQRNGGGDGDGSWQYDGGGSRAGVVCVSCFKPPSHRARDCPNRHESMTAAPKNLSPFLLGLAQRLRDSPEPRRHGAGR